MFLVIRKLTEPNEVSSLDLSSISMDVADHLGLRPVLGPAAELQSTALGIGHDPNVSRTLDPYSYVASQTKWAEVLTDEKRILVLLTRGGQPAPFSSGSNDFYDGVDRLWVYLITPSLDDTSISEVESILRSNWSIELEPHVYQSKRFDELIEQGSSLPVALPSVGEVDASRLLTNKTYRQIAVSIKSSGGLLVKDLPSQMPKGDDVAPGAVVDLLAGAGLVESEYFVVCSKTRSQAFRMPDRQALEQLTERNIRCGCGRPIAEESVEEAVSVSDFGRSLLDGNRWFNILILDELTKLGIPIDRIRLERTDGGDEVDCIADISGDVVLFELKDKEFSLGNAYSFGAKMNVIRPEYPVVVTTENVGNDAKAHFAKSRQAAKSSRSQLYFGGDDAQVGEITYIEGIDDLGESLNYLVSRIVGNDVERILGQVLPLASLNARSVVDGFFGTARDSVGVEDS